MNNKITKQDIYSELVIRLDKLEYKLDKLLALMENHETIPGPPKPFIQLPEPGQSDDEYFGETYK